MAAAILEKGNSDLHFLFRRTEVQEELQIKFFEAGITSHGGEQAMEMEYVQCGKLAGFLILDFGSGMVDGAPVVGACIRQWVYERDGRWMSARPGAGGRPAWTRESPLGPRTVWTPWILNFRNTGTPL